MLNIYPSLCLSDVFQIKSSCHKMKNAEKKLNNAYLSNN